MFESRAQLADRLTSIDAIVAKYMKRHVGMDVGIGVAGLVPLPGAGKAALVVALAAQAPLVYQPMVKQISALYARPPDRYLARLVGTANPIDAGLQLAAEFSAKFLIEQARELLHDNALVLAASWIPLVGGVAAAGVDAIIARKMTIIVASMAVLYHENRAAWLGSKTKTRFIVATAFKTGVYVSFTRFVTALVNGHIPEHERNFADSRADFGAEVDGAAVGLETGHTVDQIDPRVLDAIERLHEHLRINSLDGLKDAFTTKAGVFMDAGDMNNIKGYVGEQVVSEHLHEPLPADIRTEGWDIQYEGQDWQIKTGSTAYERSLEHLAKHPEMPVISDDGVAARLHDDGFATAMPIHNLDNSYLQGITHGTAVSIDDLIHMHPELPIISSLLITMREIKSMRSGEVGIARAISNITLQVGSREAAIAAFTFGALALSATFHILPVAGTFVAGAAVTGGLTGKEIGARLRETRIPSSVATRLINVLQSMDRAQTTKLRLMAT